jgi:16S rRNA processing protein RimM
LETGPSGWVAIAHLTRPRGNRGELSAVPLTDHPERYAQLENVRVGRSSYTVERVWYHKSQPVFKFCGVDCIGDAESLAGEDVCVPAGDRFRLPEGEFYFADLIGCRVIDLASGNLIGTVTGWEETGGPVVLELDGGRILVPYAKAILPEIDLSVREIRAALPEGLADLNGA